MIIYKSESMISRIQCVFRRHWQLFLVFVLFFATRVAGLARFPHFYDSPAYVKLAWLQQPLEAIRQSHESIHPLYIWSTQLAYRLWPEVVGVSIVSLAMGIITAIGLTYFVWRQWGSIAAVKSLLMITLFPASFLLHTHIMHEAVEHVLLIGGIIGLLEYFRNRHLYWMALSIFLFAAAIFNYVGIIFWFPLCFLVVWWARNKWNKTDWLVLGASFGLATALGYLVVTGLMLSVGIKLQARYDFFGQQVRPLLDLLTPIGLLRGVRNAVYVLFYGYGILIPFVWAGVSVERIWRKDWRSLTVLVTAAVCLVVSNYLWHGGMYGRLGAVIGLFLAVLVASLRSRWWYGLVCVSSAVSFVLTFITYQQEPIPLRQLAIIEQANPSPTDLIVISDYQRPQLNLTGAAVVGAATYPQVQIQIQQAVDSGRRVLITAPAVRFPYAQYDGQTPHILGKGSIQKAHLYPFLEQYRLQEVAKDKERPLLTVYEIHKK